MPNTRGQTPAAVWRPGPPNYEVLIQEIYEALLRDGDVAVDVGAHKGRHCLAMAERVFPHGKVLAFEPLPVCRQDLVREAAEYRPELSSVMTLYPYALSDYRGETQFVVAQEALAYSGLKERPYDWPTKLARIPVEVRTLDEFCLDLPSLRFIKIDAEGGEYHILKGGAQSIRKFRPVVVFEFGAVTLQNYRVTPKDMAHYWIDQGYKTYGIVGNYLPEEDFIKSSYAQAIHDYVAVPAEQATLERSIVEVLSRPPAWRRVSTHLDMADHNASAVGEVPLLLGFRPLQRRLVRRVAALIVRGTQVITRPQRACNRALVRAIRSLVQLLRQREQDEAGQDLRIVDCETRIGDLTRRLEVLERQIWSQAGDGMVRRAG
jgi:FkbM family methyltransferase